MKILQMVSADGWVAVFDGGRTETEQVPVVAWALVEASGGHQYLAPLVTSGRGVGHEDARDAFDFIRVTRDRSFAASESASKWLSTKASGLLSCKCGSWSGDLCAGRASEWDPEAKSCECDCHGPVWPKD